MGGLVRSHVKPLDAAWSLLKALPEQQRRVYNPELAGTHPTKWRDSPQPQTHTTLPPAIIGLLERTYGKNWPQRVIEAGPNPVQGGEYARTGPWGDEEDERVLQQIQRGSLFEPESPEQRGHMEDVDSAGGTQMHYDLDYLQSFPARAWFQGGLHKRPLKREAWSHRPLEPVPFPEIWGKEGENLPFTGEGFEPNYAWDPGGPYWE